MMAPAQLEKSGVALLASRLSRLGEDPCGGSEVVLWEDAAILQSAGIPVRVYGRAACDGAPVKVIPLRSGIPQLNSIQYARELLQHERSAAILAYNEPALAGWAPDRAIVRFDWNTPLPRYWNWPLWLPRFQRSRYLFPSEAERKLFLSQHGRIPASSTFLIPNAVDMNLFRPLDSGAKTRPKANLRVGFAGQWVPRKGIAELLDAWQVVKSNLPSTELHMAGGPGMWKTGAEIEGARPVADRVREMEKDALLQCVGALPRARMPEFWNSVDVAVVPSLYEPFGLVALEALACGVPVVTTMVGGLQEIVVNDESGLLVPPGEVKALAEALLALLMNDDLRMRLAAGARRRAQAFSLDRRSREFLQLLGESKGQGLSAVDAVSVGA